MNVSFVRDRRGMALLITVGVATILIASTLELHRMVRASVAATAVSRNQYVLAEMATSGVNIAMAMLIKDKMDSQIDSIQEDWANSEKVRELLDAIPAPKAHPTQIASWHQRAQRNPFRLTYQSLAPPGGFAGGRSS